MTPEHTRNSSVTFIVVLTTTLILAVAFAARAQNAENLFLPAVVYQPGGLNPNAVTVADVNGDGIADLVVANCEPLGPPTCGNTGDGLVAVFLGKGNGTFAVPLTFDSGGANAISVAIADVNRDGWPDLVVANRSVSSTCEQPGCGLPPGSVVSILLGAGDGTFRMLSTYSSGGYGAHSVQVADLNGDGKPDVVVANDSATFYNAPSGSVGVLLGNGDGTFQNVASSYLSGGWGTYSVAVADLNADRRLDLVVANGECKSNGMNTGCVGVLLGNGDGTFQEVAVYESGGGAALSVTVTDVNGDDKPDLLASNYCFYCISTVGTLLGNGDGTFQRAITYVSGGHGAYSVAAADANGDGKPDVFLANACTGKVSICSNPQGSIGVLLNKGNGTFQSASAFDSGGQPASFLVAADVNGDSIPDLVVLNRGDSTVNGSVGILLNTTISSPTVTRISSSQNPSFAGRPVTFTATISSSAGLPPNGEIITFSSDSATLGTVSLKAGIATLTTSSLPAKTQVIKARYPGDTNFKPSTGRFTQLVGGYATSTSLVSSLTPSIYGQKVTWAAMVTTSGSVPPTGSVVFKFSQLGGTFILGAAVLNANGVATLSRSTLNVLYPYPITAVYLGDAFNVSSPSPVLTQVVKQTTSTATITSSPNPSTRGQAVTFTAKITSPTVIVTGPVTFTAGTTVLGTAQLNRGIATFTTSALPTGSTRVQVTHAWNSNVAKSSASIVQSVQ